MYLNVYGVHPQADQSFSKIEFVGKEGEEEEENSESEKEEEPLAEYYWRKFNALHNWFVEQCAQGVDRCQKIPVSREQLQELLRTLEAICQDPSQGPKLLPTASGFFFGSTSYDEYYYQEVANTADWLRKELATEEARRYVYRASW